MASRLSLFLAELKRRKVTRVALVYVLVGLGVIEGASMTLPTPQLEAANDYIVILVLRFCRPSPYDRTVLLPDNTLFGI